MSKFLFIERDGEIPGITVAKDSLPNGEFGITEYLWGNVALWFVDEHEFTADEREEAYRQFQEVKQ